MTPDDGKSAAGPGGELPLLAVIRGTALWLLRLANRPASGNGAPAPAQQPVQGYVVMRPDEECASNPDGFE